MAWTDDLSQASQFVNDRTTDYIAASEDYQVKINISSEKGEQAQAAIDHFNAKQAEYLSLKSDLEDYATSRSPLPDSGGISTRVDAIVAKKGELDSAKAGMTAAIQVAANAESARDDAATALGEATAALDYAIQSLLDVVMSGYVEE